MTASLSLGALRAAATAASNDQFSLTDKSLPAGSAEWWLARLLKKLDDRTPLLQRYESYYNGEQELKFATRKFREAFGDLFADFSDNFAALVVDAVDERLDIEGFRIPYGKDEVDADETEEPGAANEPADSDDVDEADDDAWRIWQANQLDAESQLAHQDALVKGVTYIHVSPYTDDWIDPQTPLITAEDALQCYVEVAPGRRRVRRAAVKRWIDESGYYFANVYLPDALYKFQTVEQVVKPGGSGSPSKSAAVTRQWRPRQEPLFDAQGNVEQDVETGDDLSEPWPLDNPLGVVPIIPLLNRARLSGEGKSEIAEVLPLQDAINKECADLLLASEFAAFGQKYVTNFTLDIDPNTGKPKEPFQMGVDRLLVTPPPTNEGDPEAKFGQFAPTDLGPFVKAIEMLIQNLSSITRTPPHYFLASQGTFPSGEALRAAEAGLVTKARRRQRFYGEAWEEAMRLAFQLLSDPRGQSVISETIWRDAETRTEAEHTDAQVKQSALGVPLQQIWENLGYSPTQIARFKAMREEEAAWGLGANVNPGPIGEPGAPSPATASAAAANALGAPDPTPPTSAPAPAG